MAESVIHFGTSGWRGIIAEDFTFPNVRLAAAGIANYLLADKGKPRVIVGYDTRFLSEKFAAAAAETLGSHGVECYLGTGPDPTPALAHEIIHSRLDGGVNITASHNPAQYNGLKFSSADGAPALPEVTREIEGYVAKVQAGEYSLQGPRWPAPLCHDANPRPAYLEALPGIPTIRMFEALACGIPLASAPWHDAEQLFPPDSYLRARNGAGRNLCACCKEALPGARELGIRKSKL